MEIVLIDGFAVPKEAREEFLSNVRFSANYVKTLPGFIEGHVYERVTGNDRFSIVTTAVWESAQALQEAKQSAASAFEKLGFNPSEVMKRLGVQIERAEYRRQSY